ncbi:MAG TPA: HEAT repeat domain-containing protein [Candidatus Saccharicenans sp.]|nr:HEAT repeat domain-containing protein [Candidatus Saccharicenans sp.]
MENKVGEKVFKVCREAVEKAKKINSQLIITEPEKKVEQVSHQVAEDNLGLGVARRMCRFIKIFPPLACSAEGNGTSFWCRGLLRDRKTGSLINKYGSYIDRRKCRQPDNVSKMNRICSFFVSFVLLLSFLIAPLLLVGESGQNTATSATELAELDRLLKSLETFDHSQGEGPSLQLERLIFKIKDDPGLKLQAEQKLLEFFKQPVSRDGRIAVSKPLSWIAGLESVKVLSAFLTGPEASDPARYVLQRIPGEEADRVLLEALDKASPEFLPGIIGSIGRRRVEAAVPYFEKLLKKGTSPVVTAGILEALGNLDSTEATKLLTNYLQSPDETIHLAAVDSMVRMGQRQIKENKLEEAARISDLLLGVKLEPAQKVAAFRLKIMAAGPEAKSLLISALKGKDEPSQEAAIGLIAEFFKPDELSSLLSTFNYILPPRQIQFISALSSYPEPQVREFLMKVISSQKDEPLRIAALRTLSRVGDATTVEFLAERAAQTKGLEKTAARESLASLPGKAVDQKILELLGTTTRQEIKNELLFSACERNMVAARGFFLAEASNPAADLALVSRGLRAFGNLSLADKILEVAFSTQDETYREELINILAIWAQNSARPDSKSAFFTQLLAKENDPEKVSVLVQVIGKIGERSSLPLIRKYLSDSRLKVKEAAVKALSDWPEVEALDDLLTLASKTSDLKENVLAIRGLVRLTASQTYRQPEAATAFLKEIYSLSRRAEEKKLVLSTLPNFPCASGLEFCESLSNDPEVGQEARMAAEKIKQKLQPR